MFLSSHKNTPHLQNFLANQQFGSFLFCHFQYLICFLNLSLGCDDSEICQTDANGNGLCIDGNLMKKHLEF